MDILSMKTNKKEAGFFTILFKIVSIVIKMIALLIGREIVQRRRTQARARELARKEAQRRMIEFVSIASHELKTPLTSIKGNIQLMGRRLRSGLDGTTTTHSQETRELLGEARMLLERTDLQISSLTQLINSLLETSRINANTMELLFEVYEMDALLHEVASDSRSISKEREVHIHIPENKNITVMADIGRIRQVILHFLSNAHKYSSIEHPIKLHLCEEGQMARVSVSDEGPGIPTSELKRVWERFYRVPGIEVLNGSEVGLGLGLYISRTIIEQHHGHIGVQSVLGKGTNLWFTLPRFTGA